MKTILLPTDFSKNAQHAAAFAVSLSELFEAHLVLVHAYAPPVSTTPFVLPLPQQGLMEEAFLEAQEALQSFKTALETAYPHKPWQQLETKMLFGNASDNILALAQNLQADCIVMGTVSHPSLLCKVFGSTTLSVVQKAECPVWVVPQKAEIHGLKRVLYASDLEGDEMNCLHTLVEMKSLLQFDKARLVHVHETNEPEVFPSDEIIEMLEESFDKEQITFRNLHRNDTIVGLETYIRHQKPDLVVLAKRPKGILERLFHTSVLKHLTLSSQVPLLVLQKKY